MRILALDLATKTGWAVSQDGVLADCGTWMLSKPKEIAYAARLRMDRRLDPRIPALWDRLDDLYRRQLLDWIVWEDVQFQSTTMQCQLWSSFRTVCWLFAATNRIQTECLGVQKLKQFGAGHGGATKEMMAKALARKMPEAFSCAGTAMVFDRTTGNILDDNAVDAVHLLNWAIKTLKA